MFSLCSCWLSTSLQNKQLDICPVLVSLVNKLKEYVIASYYKKLKPAILPAICNILSGCGSCGLDFYWTLICINRNSAKLLLKMNKWMPSCCHCVSLSVNTQFNCWNWSDLSVILSLLAQVCCHMLLLVLLLQGQVISAHFRWLV